jgi:hypothetical protein
MLNRKIGNRDPRRDAAPLRFTIRDLRFTEPMSEPEIAHRCLACGASTSERAISCPECGQELGQNSVRKDMSPSDDGDVVPAGELYSLESSDSQITAPSVTPPPDDMGRQPSGSFSQQSSKIRNEGSVSAAVDKLSASDEAESILASQSEATRERVRSYGSPPRHTVAQGARDKIHRASVAARELEDDMLHKVEKIRKISTVVIDEAAYDPSLRFLLVAAALFALFLLIVLLNNLIR